jgi:hypothetical protein|tara:strand:- start:100 stop:396 length:297 start_codon:yes stop_codon:yes gene_type:complete
MNDHATLEIPKDYVVGVQTTHNRGHTPEEVAQRCVDRIISIGDETHPLIRDQARAFKEQMVKLVAHYMREAIKSDRTTVYNELKNAGQPQLAELIRRL